MMITPMESFFRTFEQLSAASNAAELAGLYAPSFLLAGPNGSQVVRAGDLQHAITKRKELFESLGCRLSRISRTPMFWRNFAGEDCWPPVHSLLARSDTSSRSHGTRCCHRRKQCPRQPTNL